MRNEELTNTIVFLLVCTAPRMRGETITVTLCFLVFFRETTLTGTVGTDFYSAHAVTLLLLFSAKHDHGQGSLWRALACKDGLE
jgi:hypothetical protein